MATSYTLSLLLNAVDKATGPIKAVITGLGELGKSAQQVATATSAIGVEGSRNIDKFRNSIQQAQKDMDGLKEAASKVVQVSTEMLIIGGSMFAAFLFPVKQAAEFEQQMARVKAVSEASAAEMADLTKTAQDLGLVTKFTATQVAEGMVDLAQAGLKANQIVAAMPSIINLASAGMLALAVATDITISVMYGMQLGISDLSHVTDVLARTAVDTNVDVQGLGEAMKYTASAAAAAGVSIEETAAAIGVLSNAGIKGTMAGTTIRGVLVKLADPTKEAKDALNALGVEILDSGGKMRDFVEIMSDLGKAGMTLQDAAKIFDIRAATGAIALTKNIGKLRELTEANKDSFGSTAKMAETMLNTIQGAWVNFMATIQAFSTAVVGPMAGGIKILIDSLNKGLQIIVRIVEATNPLSSIILALVGTLGAFLVIGGGLGLMLAGLLKLFGLLALAMSSMTVAGVTAATTTGTLATAWSALSGIAAGLTGAITALGRAMLFTIPGAIVTVALALGAALYYWAGEAERATAAANALATSTRKSVEGFEEMIKQINALTPGTMQHEEALLNLIRAYPELASKIRLTNQSWEEQNKIFADFKAGLVIKEVEALGESLERNRAKLNVTSSFFDMDNLVRGFQIAQGFITSMATPATSKTGTPGADFASNWKKAIDWVSAYHLTKQHANRAEYEATLTLMTQQFKTLGEAIGLTPEEFSKKSKEELEAMFNMTDERMELFRAQWILAGGDQEKFVAAATAAQKKIADALKKDDTVIKSPIQKMVDEAKSSAAKMKGFSADQLADFKNMAGIMTEELTKQPVGVQMAWLAAFKKIIEEYDKIPNKTQDVVDKIHDQLRNLNVELRMGALTGIGPTATTIPGAESLGFKAGSDISSIRKQAGDKAATILSNAVIDASKELGIDPSVALSIIKQSTGGSFSLGGGVTSPIQGTMWGGQDSHSKRGSWGGDIGAAAGTSVLAPTDLTISAAKLKMSNAPGGMVWAVADDGTVYKFHHLDPSVEAGMKVTAGTEIGKLSDMKDPHLDMKVRDLAGSIVDWTKGIVRGTTIGSGSALGGTDTASADAAAAARTVPATIRKIQEELAEKGKEINLWNILFAYKGGSMAPEAFKKYYDDVVRSMPGFHKGGGIEFYTAQQLEIEKKRIDDNLAYVKAAGGAQLSGKMETLGKEKALVLESNLNEQKQVANQMAQARKDNDTDAIAKLQTRLTTLRMQSASSMQILGLQEVALQRDHEKGKNEEAVKGEEFRIKLAEDAAKRQAIIWSMEKSLLAAAYAERRITADKYYSSVEEIENKEYQAQKALVDTEIADVTKVWNHKKELKAKEVEHADAIVQTTAMLAIQREAEQALEPYKEKKVNLENQHAEAIAKSNAALAKQVQSSIEKNVIEQEFANALGPIAEQQTKVTKLQYDQTEQMRAYNDVLGQSVAAYNKWVAEGSVGTKPIYAMTPEEAAAWRTRKEAANTVSMKNLEFGTEAKRWAESVTSGISTFVDALMDGTTDMRTAMNSFFKSMFKTALEPAMKQMTQYLTKAFSSMFEGLSSVIGKDGAGMLGNAVMGAIAVVGMMLTSKSKSSFSASGVTSAVTTTEAVRGVIAGDTTLPIAEIAGDLADVMAPHLSALQQIEINTRGSGSGASSQTNNYNLTQENRATTKETMDTYFNEYLLQGAKG